MAKKILEAMAEQDIPTRDSSDVGPVMQAIKDNSIPLTSLKSSLSGVSEGFQSDSKYDFGLGYKSNQNTIRARNQPWYDQLGNSLAKILPGAALSLVESTGDLAELFDNDADKAYTNAFTKFALDYKKALDEKFHTYQETPSNKFASIHDSGWWFNYGDGITQSIAGFMAIGAGVGKTLSTTAKLINAAIGRTGETALRVGQGIAQFGTAAALSYTEGVQIGAGVYQTIKEDVLRNGYDYGDGVKVPVDETEAKRIASIGSSDSVKLNTILGLGVNMTGIGPLFKSYGRLEEGIKAQIAKKAGESTLKWIDRLTVLEKTIPKQVSPLKFLALEAGQEAFEEGGINLFAESEGYRKSGAAKNMVRSDMSNAIDRFVDILFSEEGGVNALGGAVGGIVQSGALEHTPINTYTDASGNKSRVSSRTKEHLENNDYKNELIQALKGDVSTIQANQKKLSEAVISGDKVALEEARHDLFNVAALKSMRNESYKELATELSQIGAVDNIKLGIDGKTDAQRQGLSDNIEDNKYKEVAARKAADLYTLNKEYRNLSTQFENSHARDEAFRHRLNVYSAQSVVDEFTKETAETEASLVPILTDPALLSGVKEKAELIAFDNAIRFIESHRTAKNSNYIDNKIQLLKNQRVVVEAVHNETKKLDPSLNSKITANQGIVGPLVNNYTNLLLAKSQLNERKSVYQNILANSKDFTKGVKSEVDRHIKAKKDRKDAEDKANQSVKEATDLTAATQNAQNQNHTEPTPSTTTPVAVYGTLFDDPNKLNEVIGRKSTPTPTNVLGMSNNPEDEYKTLAPQEGGVAEAHLHNLTPAEIEKLDKDEKHYNRQTVMTEHGPAQAYIRKPEINSKGEKIVVPLGSSQVGAINIPSTVYQGKTAEEAKVEEFSLITTIDENTPENNNTNGRQNSFAYESQGQDKEGNTINIFDINDSYKILHSSGFSTGADLTLRVKKDYEEFDEDGRRKEDKHYKKTRYSIHNVPIEILHKGEVVGYVRRFKEGDPQVLEDLRKFMILNREAKTTISQKTWGKLNKLDSGKQSVADAFPITPKFVIGKNGKPYINIDTEYSGDLSNKVGFEFKAGFLYGIFTTPDGKQLAIPFDIVRVNKEVVQSIVAALQLFISSKQEKLTEVEKGVIKQIFETYGINLNESRGLLEYVNLFVNTDNLDSQERLQKISGENRENHYIHVTGTGIAFAKSGSVPSKNGILYANEIGINTSDVIKYMPRLMEVLANSFARVDLSKMQENAPFKAPLIRINKETKELESYDLTHNSYSDYIANNSATNIFGIRISPTEQTIFIHPTVYFDNSFLPSKQIVQSKEKAILGTPKVEEKVVEASNPFANLIDTEGDIGSIPGDKVTADQAKDLKKEC